MQTLQAIVVECFRFLSPYDQPLYSVTCLLKIVLEIVQDSEDLTHSNTSYNTTMYINVHFSLVVRFVNSLH